MPKAPRPIQRASRWMLRRLWPNQKLRWTREGIIYGIVWLGLLATGLNQQINLILLVAGLAAGPIVGSIWSSAAMLRKIRTARRVPPYAFSGEPLLIDYTLDNDRRHSAALALVLTDEMSPVDRWVSGAGSLYPRGFFPRVAGQTRARVRWEAVAPSRGRYRFRSFNLVTRSPFGLLERRVSGGEPTTITIYPSVGQLSRRWQYLHREASETKRGSRHDRSIAQQEYHGLRDYRPGDSPRWIHWRTSARLGQLMVKEFEQQHEQDLTILLDPWVPRTNATTQQRQVVEEAIRVRLDRLPGNLPENGATPVPRLDRDNSRSSSGSRLGQIAPRDARTARHAAGIFRRKSGRLARCCSSIDPPRVDPDRGVDSADQHERRGREVVATSRFGDPRAFVEGDAARRLEGRPQRPLPDRRELSPSERSLWNSGVGLPEPYPAPRRAAVFIGAGSDGSERTVNFLAMYRASFYLMLTFATLVLSVDATDDNPLAMLYPLVVAFAGALAYFTVDRNPLLSLNRSLASLVALASGALSVAEYQYDNNLLLLAAAHWLVYLQIIKMFLPKTVEDDWFLFLLGLVQVLVGGVISQSDKVGVMLLCWALTSLWVLTLFALRREALRMEPVPFGSSDLVAADRSEPYRGLFDIPFLFATIRVAGITLAMGGLIFLAMPRRMMSGSSNSSDSVGKHLSGFDDEVQLGQLGEILENDSVVMTIDQTDLQGKRIVPVNGGPEDRWRGITLDSYLKGRWKRPKLPITGYTLGFPGYSQNNPVIRQQIKLEPTDSPILFGLRPVVDTDATDKRFMPALNEVDGSLFRGESRAVSIDYQVFSSPDANLAQGGESYPLGDYLARLVEVPPDVLEKIRPVAQEIVKGIDPGDTQARASALQEYLRGPGTGFRYTLAMDVVDPSLDPAVDFILNRKQGHCEYFATALTLLARSVGLPARMVNGFKGGDYNAMSGLTTVRQKHAHSWVEVLVDRDPSNEFKAFWITFDPTPADQRNASVAQVGGMAGNFREITDYIRYIWVFYVVGFNAER